ncbi:hypothetical protein C273_00710 [Staphylococcus massiliensis S46]|uniref:Peptidase M16 C-terminal domain-containing protein n=2 Tax=Staphylococcus massiliensis TaxID=555791 RepID=K9B6P6_9STAP|nr:hypothetical protein C273_00710 [Staphylococcus massiliensis S46]
MDNLMKDEPLIHTEVTPTDKFKTTIVTFKFMAPLDVKTMTHRSLLSKILVRATQKWPDDKAFNRHLSDLYGAYIHSYVSKFKDKHVITISLEIVNERYLTDDTPLFEKGLELLNEIIWNPLVENGAFNTQFLQQEKSLLRKKLKAMNDNKSQLAYLNLLKHMFNDHPYRFLATGDLTELEKVTPASLYETYQSMIENDFCSVYVVGNVNKAAAEEKIKQQFAIKPFTYKPSQISAIHNNDETNTIVEYADVDQAKLNMGFKFNTEFGKDAYFALVVFNMMFGGDPSSVLFNEVREKQSLAYSIHSQIDAKNGFLFVLSGVSKDKYEQAKDTIIEEFTKIKNGEFSDNQLNLAKKIIQSHRLESKDRPKNMIEIMHNQLLLDVPMTDEMFIQNIKKVSRADVQNLCDQAELDTIYILTKEEDVNE